MSGELVLSVVLTVLSIALALAVVLVLRRAVISRRGVVECSLRHSSEGHWQHGLAEYRRGQLYWHRSTSLRLRPHAAFDRSQLTVLRSRPAAPSEDVRLGPGVLVVQCQALVRHRGGPARWRELELAMCPEALTGLLAWLEASPIYRTGRAS